VKYIAVCMKERNEQMRNKRIMVLMYVL